MGLIPVFFGHAFLDYSAWSYLLPFTDEVMARSHSMLAVEIGVALTVMCGMYGIYMSLVSDGGDEQRLMMHLNYIAAIILMMLGLWAMLAKNIIKN